jgi:phage gp46-like protein
MAQSLQCEPFAIPGQRRFWTTQLDACGSTETCEVNVACGRPGLLLQRDAEDQASFATNDWVRSIALNMLLTDARRRDSLCGHIPGTINGHWSDSFIGSGAQALGVGSHVRYVTSSSSVRDAMQMIKAEVLATLHKLIDYGIAVDVQVEATYKGSGSIFMDIQIFGTAVDPTRIGVTAQRNENAWAWVI